MPLGKGDPDSTSTGGARRGGSPFSLIALFSFVEGLNPPGTVLDKFVCDGAISTVIAALRRFRGLSPGDAEMYVAAIVRERAHCVSCGHQL